MKIIIANWKLYLERGASCALAQKLVLEFSKSLDGKKLIVCPSFVSLKEVGDIFRGTDISLGAQDVFWEDVGSYTGEISPRDLKELGCGYVIVGHSERRKFFKETHLMAHEKIKACLRVGLIPVLCVGENWEERRLGQRDVVIIQTLHEVFGGIHLRPDDHIIVAYEPVWAISGGGGVNASAQEAEYAHQLIRHMLLDLYDMNRVNDSFRIIYGGSVNPSNIDSYTNSEHIDGVLVGNASVKADSFLRLIEKA